jgi:predicted nucleotidyltransferase
MFGTKSRVDVQPILDQIKAYLRQRFGDGIEAILLYGSYARGCAKPESDIDILVVVRDALKPTEVRQSLSDLLYDILLEHGELVSVIVLPRSLYEASNSLFLHHVRQEAVPI